MEVSTEYFCVARRLVVALALLFMSTATAEPVTISVSLEIAGASEPLSATLEIPSAESASGTLTYTHQGENRSFTYSPANLSELYRLYRRSTGGLEVKRSWRDFPIWFPARLSPPSQKPLFIKMREAEGTRIFYTHVPLTEEQYVVSLLQNILEKRPLVTMSYAASGHLDRLETQPRTALESGDPILFFPEGREMNAIPAVWMARDAHARDLFVLHRDYNRFLSGDRSTLPIFGAQRAMIAVPSRDAFAAAIEEDAAHQAANPTKNAMRLWPWNVLQIDDRFENPVKTIRWIALTCAAVAPCGTIFRASAPLGAPPENN